MNAIYQLPQQAREAEFRAASFNKAANTVDVIWSTGATVRRRTWQNGDFDEELVMTTNAVRLDRLNAGAPLLNSHSGGSLSDVIGSVVPGSARIVAGQGLATVRLSAAPGDADNVQKIRDGIVRNISVGYRIHKAEKIETKGASVPILRVVDWEPLEISAVPVPADPGAQIRGAETLFRCEISSLGRDYHSPAAAQRAVGVSISARSWPGRPYR
jgi:HK97 family phage prohead protease